MRKMITLGLYFALLVTIFCVNLTHDIKSAEAGQASTNYSIDTDVLSGGGSECSSSSFYLLSTMDQPTAIGPASSTNYLNYAGFWYTLLQQPQGCYWLGDINTYIENGLRLDPKVPC